MSYVHRHNRARLYSSIWHSICIIGHLILALLLAKQVFGLQLTFSGNNVHPQTVLIDSESAAVAGGIVYDDDGEIGNAFPSMSFGLIGDALAASTTLFGIQVRFALV